MRRARCAPRNGTHTGTHGKLPSVLGVRLRCGDSRQRRRQEAEHDNVLPQASQNSGSKPKSTWHVRVSCCNCAARLRVPALAWRRTLWRRCMCHHQLCQCARDSARLQHGLRAAHAEALAPTLP